MKKISAFSVSLLLILYTTLSCSQQTVSQDISHPKLSNNSVIWIGHATTLFNVDGITFLTDPILSDCLVVLKRKNKLGLKVEQLPNVDVILISHAHIDHFHKSTLRKLSKSIKVIAPKDLQDDILALGFINVIATNENDVIKVGSVKVITKPVSHASPSVSYIIEGSKTVYFGGDSAYFSGYKKIAQQHDIDLALLPIGPIHAESLKAHHLTPNQAIQAFLDLKAQKILPIHHSTFRQGPAMLWPVIDIHDEIRIFEEQLNQNSIIHKSYITKPGVKYLI